jgi:hypothetical protein
LLYVLKGGPHDGKLVDSPRAVRSVYAEDYVYTMHGPVELHYEPLLDEREFARGIAALLKDCPGSS